MQNYKFKSNSSILNEYKIKFEKEKIMGHIISWVRIISKRDMREG